MEDHVSLRGPGGEGRPLVSLSKNFPPGMDLGRSCEPADSLFACCGMCGFFLLFFFFLQ